MIDLQEYKKYLEKIGLASNSINFYSSHITTGLEILNSIEEFKDLADIEKLKKFSQKGKTYRKFYDSSHNGGKDTFSDNRSVARSYIRFLQYKKLLLVLKSYNENPSKFNLNGAHNFFKIFNQNK